MIAYWNYKENQRHNVAAESHNRDVLSENTRHNLAVETEAHRSNVAREEETHRSNVAHETETHRHNVVVETETERANRANEDIKRESNAIGWANVSLGYANLAEATRHNKANESISQQSVTEAARHNRATERVSYLNYAQTGRHNSAMVDYYNTQSDRKFITDLLGLGIQQQRADEDKRHHLVDENLSQQSVNISRGKAVVDGMVAISNSGRGWYSAIVNGK
jgi:hypothetical protein